MKDLQNINPDSENLETMLKLDHYRSLKTLKWLNSREAVMYLRLPSTGALRNLVYRRKIPFVKLGRMLRFDREALDQFLESSQTIRRIA